MSKHEMIEVLDDEGGIVDTVSREEAERDNRITKNALVFIFNPLGSVWVQLRPKTKSHYPGRWDISACGGVISGESHREAADRETLEEMAIQVELHFVESFLNTFPGDDGEERKRLSYLYIGVSDQQPQTNDEVDAFKLWPPSELRADAEARPGAYVPSFILELDKAIEAHKQFSQ